VKGTNWLISLALRAYPAAFREESGEEVLSTILDCRDAGDSRGSLRQAVSLVHGALRLRWLRGTGGSIAETFRQGLTWGVLFLIAWHVGLPLRGLLRPLLNGDLLGYPGPSFLALSVAFAVGWLLVLLLLVSGRQTWGLILLGAVVAGYVAREVIDALSYGGPFSWEITLRYSLPMMAPLLCAYLRPGTPPRLSLRAVAILVIMALLVPASLVTGNGMSSMTAWAIEVGTWALAAIILLVAGSADPRWAVAITPLVFGRLLAEFIPEVVSRTDFAGYSGVLMLAVLIPIGAWGLVLWARRRTLPRRGRTD
jgi:hypothetical protein